MKTVTALLVLLMGASLTDAQVTDILWTRTFGGSSMDGGTSVCETGDGGLLVTGYTFSSGNGSADIYAIKTDSDGNELWSKSFGGEKRDYGHAGCSTSDGSYLIVGYTTSFGAGKSDVYAVKIDADGDEIWSKTYGGTGTDKGRAVIETSSGDYVICGYTETVGPADYDVYLIWIDAQGTELRTRTYGGDDSEFGMSVMETSDGGLIVGGITGTFGAGNRDAYLIKTDAQGNVEWSNPYGAPPDYEVGYSVCETEDGGYVIAGHSDIHLSDLMTIDLIKTDANGIQTWARTFGEGTYYDYAKSVSETTRGGFIVCGATKDAATVTNNVYLIQTDSEGNQLWTKEIGGPGTEWGSAVCVTPGGYVVTGHTDAGGAGLFDVLLLKVSDLLPHFEAIPNTGHAPFDAEFHDESYGSATSWRWDFDGDGAIDAEGPNPRWTYDTPGTYSVTLEISDGFHAKTLVREDYIRIFDGESALEFNASNGVVRCAASTSLGADDALTVEAWINPFGWGEVPNSGYGRIIDKSNYALYLNGEGSAYSDSSLVLLLKTGSGGPPSVSTTPVGSVRLDTWQHVAATYDGTSGNVCLYIDGIPQPLDQTSAPEGPIRDHSNVDLTIGNAGSEAYTFDGRVDEVRIWDSVRSEDEIQANRGAYLQGTEENLVCYLQMNEGYGGIVSDGTTHGNDGTITAASWVQGAPILLSTDDEIIPLVNTDDGFALHSGYPNPFGPETTLGFDLPKRAQVSLSIYNCSGRRVKVLVNEDREAGYHMVRWDGTDTCGTHVPSGTYLYRLASGGFTATRACMFVK